ncbi:hypothetical protein ACHAWF_011953 [Thalassiosira exigua]
MVVLLASRIIKRVKKSREPTKPTSPCENALRQYVAAFDGRRKSFSDVKPLFDALYHEGFTRTSKEGEISTRDAVEGLHADYLSRGAKLSLVHLQPIGVDCVDVQLRVESEEEKPLFRAVFSVEDGKFARATVVDSIASSMKTQSEKPKFVRPSKRVKARVRDIMEKRQTKVKPEA